MNNLFIKYIVFIGLLLNFQYTCSSKKEISAKPNKPSSYLVQEIGRYHKLKVPAMIQSGNSSFWNFRVREIFQNSKDEFWVNGAFGLYIYNDKKDEIAPIHFLDTETLSKNYADTLQKSNDGKIWVLHVGQILCFDRGQWHRVDPPDTGIFYKENFPKEYKDSFIFNIINKFRIIIKGQDKTYFIRDDGIFFNSGEKWESSLYPSEEIERQYRAIQIKNVNGIQSETIREKEIRSLKRTFGTRDTFTQIFDKKPITILSETYSGLEDSQGYIWLGTDRGILRFREDKKWIIYPLPENLIQASYIYEDRKGRLWFADHYGHIAVYDKSNNKWITYDLKKHLVPPGSIPPNSPYILTSIFHDKYGDMLFGTGYGLLIFNENTKSWNVYTQKNSGLPDDSITCIYEDLDQKIWLGTGLGVVVVEP